MREALVVAVGLVSAAAHAGPPDAFAVVEPAIGRASPRVAVSIIGLPPPCSLRFVSTRASDAGEPIQARATRTSADEPLALVIVVHTAEPDWISETDGYPPRELDVIARSFDRFDKSRLGPAGGEFAVVGYAVGARVVTPFTPLAKLDGAAIRAARTPPQTVGIDLVHGIELGLAQLATKRAPRKAMIVFGDGNDTDDELAARVLPVLAQRARAEHVEIFAVVTKTALSKEGTVMPAIVNTVVTQHSPEDMTAELARISTQLTNRVTYVFPGEALPWDGAVHPLAVTCGEQELAIAVALSPVWNRPTRARALPIGLAIAGAFAGGLAFVVLRARRSRRP